MDAAIKNHLKSLRKELNLEEGDDTVYTHVRELILDGTPIKTMTPEDADMLSRCKNLVKLSLNGTGLTSMTNFPEMRSLKVLEMTDNYLSDTVIFSIIPTLFPNLSMLHLGGNHLKSLDDIHLLSNMKHLVALGLAMNPLAESENYRERVFAALPKLQSLDQVDHSGVERHVDSDAEYYEEDEGEEDDVLKKFYEANYNSDDDQNDDEFVPDDAPDDEEDFYEEDDDEEEDEEEEGHVAGEGGSSSSSSKRPRADSDDEEDAKRKAV